MQEYIVAAIVIGAAWAVVRRYAPAILKAACADLTLRTAKRFGWNSLARLLEKKPTPAMDCASGCSTCSGCDAASKTSSGQLVVRFDNLKRRN